MHEISVKLISFATSLVLLWYLSPSEFGSFFFVWLFFSAFAVWRNGGAQETIMRFGNDNPGLWQAQFWQLQLKSGYSIFLLILLLIFDHLILGFTLSFSLWVSMVLIFILEGLYCIPQYIGELKKDFKTIFKCHLIAELLASASGIWLAANGYGIYAISIKMLVSVLIKTAGMWTYFYFPLGKVLSSVSPEEKLFGKPLAYTKTLNYMARNIDDYMIGRYLGDAALGIYNRVYNISLYPFLQWGSAVNRAILPEAGINEKQNKEALFLNLFSFNLYTYSIAALALYWWCPVMVLQFLPEIWYPAAPLFKIFAWVLFFQGISRPNSVFFTLTGDTWMELKLNIFLKINTIIWLAVGVFLFEDIEMIATCYLTSVVISSILQWIILSRILKLQEGWWKSAILHMSFIAFCWVVFQYIFEFSPFWMGLSLLVFGVLKLLIFDRHQLTSWKSFVILKD